MKTSSLHTAEPRSLLWGHPLLTPEGAEIRVPNIFTELKRMGLIRRNRERGIYQLLPLIDTFMDSQYDGIMGALRRVLGRELEGPEWVKCRCKECRGQNDKSVSLPWATMNRPDVIKAMQQRKAR